MSDPKNPKQEKIDRYLDQSLKKVFADYQDGEMPDEMLDLLSVLRAQDAELKDRK